jgi:hypothetical protein
MSEDLMKDVEDLIQKHKNKKATPLPLERQVSVPATAAAPPKKEKRKCTEKQLAALAAGRKKAAAKWLAN